MYIYDPPTTDYRVPFPAHKSKLYMPLNSFYQDTLSHWLLKATEIALWTYKSARLEVHTAVSRSRGSGIWRHVVLVDWHWLFRETCFLHFLVKELSEKHRVHCTWWYPEFHQNVLKCNKIANTNNNNITRPWSRKFTSQQCIFFLRTVSMLSFYHLLRFSHAHFLTHFPTRNLYAFLAS
jgi:hypothetical protein